MAGQYGTTQIKKVLFAGIGFAEAGEDFVGAPTTLGKAAAVLDTVDDVLSLATIDVEQLEREWREMDNLDWEDLRLAVADEFDLANDELEEDAEFYFQHGMAIVRSVQALVARRKLVLERRRAKLAS